MDYSVVLLPEVSDKLVNIRDYISEHFSEEIGRKRVSDIVTGLGIFSTFPELGFDFDQRIGK